MALKKSVSKENLKENLIENKEEKNKLKRKNEIVACKEKNILNEEFKIEINLFHKMTKFKRLYINFINFF